jgi:hypothetical protein
MTAKVVLAAVAQVRPAEMQDPSRVKRAMEELEKPTTSRAVLRFMLAAAAAVWLLLMLTMMTISSEPVTAGAASVDTVVRPELIQLQER